MEAQPLLVERKYVAIAAEMTRWQIEEMEKAIKLRKLNLMADTLKERGFRARLCVFPRDGEDEFQTQVFDMLLIAPPEGAESTLNEWADLSECRRLIDTVANMPLPEAFDRWVQGLPLPAPYTESDARNDRRAELLGARQRYDAGTDDALVYSATVKGADDYLAWAESPDRNAHLRTIPQLAGEWDVSTRRAQAHVKHLHAKLGVGRKLGNIWVLTDTEAVQHKPADAPGRPKNE